MHLYLAWSGRGLESSTLRSTSLRSKEPTVLTTNSLSLFPSPPLISSLRTRFAYSHDLAIPNVSPPLPPSADPSTQRGSCPFLSACAAASIASLVLLASGSHATPRLTPCDSRLTSGPIFIQFYASSVYRSAISNFRHFSTLSLRPLRLAPCLACRPTLAPLADLRFGPDTAA